MKPCAFFLLLAGIAPASSQDWIERYASFGRLVVTNLAAAPFPHAARASGHTYGDRTFPVAEHYSDSSVAIFIPSGFQAGGLVNYVVHFHGWRNHVESVLNQFKLIEQFSASGCNAILIVPQGPKNAPDSFGGKLEDAGGFKAFMEEVQEFLRGRGLLTNTSPGSIVVSAHSGGYRVTAAILDRGGLSDRIKEVWLFDALYADTGKFLAWQERYQGRLLNIHTANGGTRDDCDQMTSLLAKRNAPFLAVKESGITPALLRTHKVIFLESDLGHNEVIEKHGTFRVFLETSSLPRSAQR